MENPVLYIFDHQIVPSACSTNPGLLQGDWIGCPFPLVLVPRRQSMKLPTVNCRFSKNWPDQATTQGTGTSSQLGRKLWQFPLGRETVQNDMHGAQAAIRHAARAGLAPLMVRVYFLFYCNSFFSRIHLPTDG